MIMKRNCDIVLTVAVTYDGTTWEPGTVFRADFIDENGFAGVESLDMGFFCNEYEIHYLCLENE